ncbi:FAST kinase-like protein, subdomain 1 [Nesidiocoris tenuis]|uniref:FAST kinase-like protein, subdomain 1 n=1 Tax=Nesidiocoris tenuis TaxID=355587 RepID=A0ABN7AV93_9HEMI|nr:FAST kinase-like protein, subdomain 1 [Nesidiocoris tenuis]
MLRTASRRLAARILQQLQRPSSSGPTAALHSDKIEEGQKAAAASAPEGSAGSSLDRADKNDGINQAPVSAEVRSKLVSAAFASLKQTQQAPRTSLDDQIMTAKDPETLLSMSESSTLNKKQILRIVTTLAEWSVSGQADVSKYESDPRFVSLCQMLGRTPKRSSPTLANVNKTGDLSLVLNVTGDDEAAKLISTITLPQMIKVMLSLAIKKRRSIPLLQALSFNISRSSTVLDIKQGADVLYALACLNFPDEVLLGKVCCDVIESVARCQKTSVIGSISTSLGLLKYKDENLLDELIAWTVKNKELTRSQDLMSLLHTLASVNYQSPTCDKFFEVISPVLALDEAPSCGSWLDIVWSLSVCERAAPDHLRSVLDLNFVEKISSLTSNSANFSWKKKLLNINGVAKFTQGYKGPFLNEETTNFSAARGKDKQALVKSVIDALSSLVPSEGYLRTDVDSGMGFLIDSVCLIDDKMTPLPIVDKTVEMILNQKPKRGRKVAIMVRDYHDHTRGKVTLCGTAAVSSSLLTKAGYHVLNISYKDYNPRDKLSDRVAYLQNQLKSLLSK